MGHCQRSVSFCASLLSIPLVSFSLYLSSSPRTLPSQKCVVLSVKDTVWAAKQVVLDKLNQVLISTCTGAHGLYDQCVSLVLGFKAFVLWLL